MKVTTLFLCCYLAAMLGTTGCGSKKEPETKPEEKTAPAPAAAEQEPPETPIEESSPAGEDPVVSADQLASQFERIYFNYDEASLTSAARMSLKKNARLLMDNPEVSVTIEGHCDERGTNEYNLALGSRRAQSVRDYLIDLGVAESRLSTVSKGEEEPLVLEQTDAAFAQNRRAEFVPSR
ncbi:MAG: peptidoglycan-associated lipoprotein [Deltaproteobacteria bacterium RIFOXYA12_FULL_61_11]|nr:MAG: peptidoglycan-associated lipoprotein [Deltaproteobacteria bacterium RIFOXYA12_FULL_61_11]